ncbi:MAG TPA: (d)CMP kinase [Actinomycetota bacterium]|nr:(d)CMP kinase [Actinomycetota bacterium]
MSVIAIDGPAGAGKSTIARAVADRLGFEYLDTGAMYRALALAAIESGADLEDADALTALADSVDIELRGDVVKLNGRDVSEVIRGPDVTAAVSKVAAVDGVRRAMAAMQRARADAGNLVMEGRDIGSAVVPAADVKIFLTASKEERALRRARQLGLATDVESLKELSQTIEDRDRADAQRTASPFVKANDAVVVDSTGKDVEEIVEEIASAALRVIDER